MATYNGHNNWNFWNVSLWIFDSEYLYSELIHQKNMKKTKDEIARYMIDHVLPEKTPDGARYTFSAVRAALYGDF